MGDHDAVIDRLLQSDEPSIRFKIRTGVLGEAPGSRSIRALRNEVRRSPRVQALLSDRDATGRIAPGRHVYNKWRGAHWVMASLADLGYPTGDRSLRTTRDALLDCWLSKEYYEEFPSESKAGSYRKKGVPVIRGRHRRCASQQSNSLYSVITLGLGVARCERIVERLLHWQWPDGGWNCDRNPAARMSSFMETILPLRALALYADETGDRAARRAAKRAAEVLLERELFKRRSDGRTIAPDFVRLHYPLYWHYDILHGLKVLAEAGLIDDPRCSDALDRLESLQLADGGWPATARHYRCDDSEKSGNEQVDWGGTSRLRMNEWVSADALTVLRAAGRL